MVTLRERQLEDAERFWHLLSNPKFVYFGRPPKDIEGERAYIQKELNNPHLINYTIMYDDIIVGGIGVKLSPHRDWIGEIGYFVDAEYWNKGIASKALKLCEKPCYDASLRRLELLIDERNTASRVVALKCGYELEGKLKSRLKTNGFYSDGFMYSKLI